MMMFINYFSNLIENPSISYRYSSKAKGEHVILIFAFSVLSLTLSAFISKGLSLSYSAFILVFIAFLGFVFIDVLKRFAIYQLITLLSVRPREGYSAKDFFKSLLAMNVLYIYILPFLIILRFLSEYFNPDVFRTLSFLLFIPLVVFFIYFNYKSLLYHYHFPTKGFAFFALLFPIIIDIASLIFIIVLLAAVFTSSSFLSVFGVI